MSGSWVNQNRCQYTLECVGIFWGLTTLSSLQFQADGKDCLAQMGWTKRVFKATSQKGHVSYLSVFHGTK